jgi:hypothetical protein
MTAPTGADLESPEDRAADLVLARLHLRLGSFGLARTELESMAGRNLLDLDGIRDLAEVRWRTGDLPGAGDAASAYLEERPDDPLALLISAEMQAHLGRPGEARRLSGRALSLAGTVDRLFAGMPRSSVWPSEPGGPTEPPGILFEELGAGPGFLGSAQPSADSSGVDAPGATGDGTDEAAPEQPPDGPQLWDASLTAAPVLPDANELLARARDALDGERPGQAAAGLALAIRAQPSLAPAVLDLLAGRQEPVLALVRGDAHRIVGHESEALRDYSAAVAAIGLERRSDRRQRGTSATSAAADPWAPGASGQSRVGLGVAGGAAEPAHERRPPPDHDNLHSQEAP